MDVTALQKQFADAGQAHVFRFWDSLTDLQKEQLAHQAASIDLTELNKLVDQNLAPAVDREQLTPPQYIAHPDCKGSAGDWIRAQAAGEEALKNGLVAAFMVAGGQGTRLGFDGPKGSFVTMPISGKSLFHIFADKIQAAEAKYRCHIPWFIMTSHANHEATLHYFDEHGYFGLERTQVEFFMQGRMPAVSPEGKILLETPYSIALSPDGHGGSLRALVRSGAIARMKERGIRYLSYFQVDNPLVRCVDPAFIGFHVLNKSEMSSKMITKSCAAEKVGVFCQLEGRTQVVEYSDLPVEIQEQTDSDGQLRFRCGSIAVHILNISFIERLAGSMQDEVALPFHRALKKVPYVNDAGDTIAPEAPNAYKFELFVFDALPFAKNPVIVESLRSDEFSPIKNAEGVDSPSTARSSLLKLWASWATFSGIDVPRGADGEPAFSFEVSPLFAENREEFAKRWNELNPKPDWHESLYLDSTLSRYGY
jgi:UDP-N-acetylglucosamine/UDP-N-acetylgalactosamine diphosphorylase